MKKILLTLFMVISLTESTHSMWQRVWKHTKTGGRIGAGTASIISAGTHFNAMNQWTETEKAEKIIEQIKPAMRYEHLKNLNDFSDQLKNRIGIPDCEVKIVPIDQDDFFGTASSLNNKNRHILLVPQKSFDSILAGRVDHTIDSICLHEGVHMRNQDNLKSQALKTIIDIATGAIYLKVMPARFKILTLLATRILPTTIRRAFVEDRADEDGPFTLGTKEEVKEFSEFFSQHDTPINTLSLVNILADYHPATSYRIKRAEQRRQYLEALELLNAKIEQATTKAEIQDLQSQKKQLENDWKNNSTTLGRMWDGFKAYFK